MIRCLALKIPLNATTIMPTLTAFGMGQHRRRTSPVAGRVSAPDIPGHRYLQKLVLNLRSGTCNNSPRPSPNCSMVSDNGLRRIFLSASLRSTSWSSSGFSLPANPPVYLKAANATPNDAPAPNMKGRLRPMRGQSHAIQAQNQMTYGPIPPSYRRPYRPVPRYKRRLCLEDWRQSRG